MENIVKSVVFTIKNDLKSEKNFVSLLCYLAQSISFGNCKQ